MSVEPLYDYALYMCVCLQSGPPDCEGAVGYQPGDHVLNVFEGPWFVSPKTFSLSLPGPGNAAHEGLQWGQDADVDNGAVHG